MILDNDIQLLFLWNSLFECSIYDFIVHSYLFYLYTITLILYHIKNSKANIFVEGYTDNLPVKTPVVDYQRFCTVYDDNFTLSAARAREARRYLIGSLDADSARRVVVAGYGDSKPLIGIDPTDSKNRRVEVLFMIEQESKSEVPANWEDGAESWPISF